MHMAVETKSITPEQLLTPTDLHRDEVEAIREAVNPLIADALALYVKTKNFHWHLSGSHFRDYHLLFDEQADSRLNRLTFLRNAFGELAALPSAVSATLDNYRQFAMTMTSSWPWSKWSSACLKTIATLPKRNARAIQTCDEHRDTPTGNVSQEVLDRTEKRIWFLYEVSQGGRNVAFEWVRSSALRVVPVAV
jgi:starvation-inducible DNA-binding protein